MLSRENSLYQPFYCEENIWQLCQNEYFKGKDVKVLFLLPTEAEHIALWYQKLSEPEKPIFWDYHVILLDVSERHVYDFDTYLYFPSNAKSYFRLTFGIEYPKYLPKFKVFDSKDFIERFNSDRSHMIDERGMWLAEPPSWSCILSENGVDLKQILFQEKSLFSENFSYYEVLEWT